MASPVTFGEWLRGQRAGRKLTREEFAERVGCSVALLRKIEDGERRPSAQIAELMANSLNIPATARGTFVKVARGELNVERLAPISTPPTKPASPASAPSWRANLPVLPTPLVGRQHEVQELGQLLGDPYCRLLTLVGPGGIGKTRLAIETASQVQDTFADGVYFVPLASANSPRSVVPLIADSVGFAFQGAGQIDPNTQLFGYLQEKQALLLADNLEQLLTEPGIEVLAELLAHASHVKLLTTSREPLRLQGEWVFEVQGLPIPESDDADASAHDTSAELFLQRARRAHFGFQATPRDYPAIVRVCQLMSGNPLGIELAAAWVRTLSCDEIVREIERGMDFLSVSTRDVPARHRSMRAVFDQSWKLLTEEEQAVLLRLAVFRGGFRREAGEQVAGATLPVLSSLVAKSLIRRGGDGRYDLHELIQQYAAERFAQRAEVQAEIRARHGRHYLAYFGQADRRLRSAAQRETLTELTTEMDNFRAAWEWAVSQGEFALIEPTMPTFWLMYDIRGWYQEGLDTLGHAVNALDLAHGRTPPERTEQVVLGRLLATRAWLAYRIAHYEEAQAMLERSLAVLRPLNERHALVEAIWFLGMLMEITGNYTRALELYSEGLEMATAVGDRWLTTGLRTNLNGLIAITQVGGKPENAHEGLQSAVADWRLIGDPRYTAFGLRLLSNSALAQERYDEARAALEESAALNESVGDRWGLGSAYRGLGIAAQALGQHQEAVVMFGKSLDTFTELGGNWWVARVRAEMSRSVFALGDATGARRVCRESLRIATDIHATPVALEALASFASLQAEPADREQALELLLIVLDHPASLQETKNRARHLHIELQAQLTQQQIEAAQARAQAKSFEVAVEEVLQQI